MKLNENTYKLLKKVQEITYTDYEIYWKDKEKLDGYIDNEGLVCAIQDLLMEVERLQEKIEELENKDYEDPYSYEAWEEQRLMEVNNG